MICPIYSHKFDTIPDEIADKSLLMYPYHNVITHLGCSLLRISVGITLINPNITPKKRNTMIFIIIIALLVFGIKYIRFQVIKDTPLWKSYLRMLVAYSTALCLLTMKQDQFAGIVVIADALMGINSRHMASVLTCGMK